MCVFADRTCAFADRTWRSHSERECSQTKRGVCTPNVRVRRPNVVFADRTCAFADRTWRSHSERECSQTKRGVCTPNVRVRRPNVCVRRLNAAYARLHSERECSQTECGVRRLNASTVYFIIATYRIPSITKCEGAVQDRRASISWTLDWTMEWS